MDRDGVEVPERRKRKEANIQPTGSNIPGQKRTYCTKKEKNIFVRDTMGNSSAAK